MHKITCPCGFEIALVPDIKTMTQAIENHLSNSHHLENPTQRSETREALISKLLTKITTATPQQQQSQSITGTLYQPYNYATNMKLIRGDTENDHNHQDINNFLQQFKGKQIKITVEIL